MPVNGTEHMQPVTAGAHICSLRADAREEGVGRPGKDGAAEAPPPPGSRVRRGHCTGRAVGALRAGLALGARVSLATALQSPGRRRVIDGPRGDRRQVPATSRGRGAPRRARPGAGRPRRPSSPSSIVLVTGLPCPGPSLMQVARRCAQELGPGAHGGSAAH